MRYIDTTIAGYPGGKNKIALKYLYYIPYNKIATYVEAFGGMFGVGLKVCYPIRIYNDINKKLALLLEVLCNTETFYDLMEEMLKIPYSQETFNKALELSNNLNQPGYNKVQLASYIWFLLLTSFNGQMKMFRGIKNGTEEDVFRHIILNKQDLGEMLKGVQVKNMNALSIIKEYRNDEKAFLFLDPPYTKLNNNSNRKRASIYEYELLNDEQHSDFLHTILNGKAKMLVCSYDNELYNNILVKENGWLKTCISHGYKSMSMSGREKKREAIEFIYTNYDIREVK